MPDLPFFYTSKPSFSMHAHRRGRTICAQYQDLNVYAYRYFRNDTFVRTQYQLGLTPDFVYRVQF